MQNKKASQIFFALGDETRVNIMKKLYKQENNVSELLKNVNCSQSTLSYHLSILYENGLVSYQKIGKKVFYSCNKAVVNNLMKYIAS